jgi:hypothetical protein
MLETKSVTAYSVAEVPFLNSCSLCDPDHEVIQDYVMVEVTMPTDFTSKFSYIRGLAEAYIARAQKSPNDYAIVMNFLGQQANRNALTGADPVLNAAEMQSLSRIVCYIYTYTQAPYTVQSETGSCLSNAYYRAAFQFRQCFPSCYGYRQKGTPFRCAPRQLAIAPPAPGPGTGPSAAPGGSPDSDDGDEDGLSTVGLVDCEEVPFPLTPDHVIDLSPSAPPLPPPESAPDGFVVSDSVVQPLIDEVRSHFPGAPDVSVELTVTVGVDEVNPVTGSASSACTVITPPSHPAPAMPAAQLEPPVPQTIPKTGLAACCVSGDQAKKWLIDHVANTADDDFFAPYEFSEDLPEGYFGDSPYGDYSDNGRAFFRSAIHPKAVIPDARTKKSHPLSKRTGYRVGDQAARVSDATRAMDDPLYCGEIFRPPTIARVDGKKSNFESGMTCRKLTALWKNLGHVSDETDARIYGFLTHFVKKVPESGRRVITQDYRKPPPGERRGTQFQTGRSKKVMTLTHPVDVMFSNWRCSEDGSPTDVYWPQDQLRDFKCWIPPAFRGIHTSRIPADELKGFWTTLCNCGELAIMLFKAALAGDLDMYRKLRTLRYADFRDQEKPTSAYCGYIQSLGRKVVVHNKIASDKRKPVQIFDGIWLPKVCSVAYEVARQRFTQYPLPVRNHLLRTASCGVIAEFADYDPIWGVQAACNHESAYDMSKWEANALGWSLTCLRDDMLGVVSVFNRARP